MTAPLQAKDLLLVFDLDGTLYRTEASFVPTMKAVYAEYGIPHPGDDAAMAYVGEPFDSFLTWLISEGFPANKSRLADEITSREFDSIASRGELYPGVAETLETFQARGIRLAICTNGDVAYVDAILGKFGLRSVFDRIATHAESGQTKTEMVAELIVALQPKHTLVIGDRRHDFEAGRANGCTVVAASYGFADDWKSADADVVLLAFTDLIPLVDGLLRG